MRTIDCRDMLVPKPVVLAKSTLEELPDDCAVIFIVNCDMSEDNILTYAQSKGYFVKKEQKKAGTFITIAKSFTCNIDFDNKKEKKIQDRALFITSDCIGRGLYGDELMQEFLESILLQKSLPSKIVFLNQGVKLTCNNPNNQNLQTIRKIEDKGVKILVSLKSLSDYELFEKNCIGEAISMFELAEMVVFCNTSTI
jgi:selenium metabolism protein YedF